MKSVKTIWSAVWKRVSGPEVDPARVERRLQEAKAGLPPPVLWLLGKAQSGKTSLIHAMTGSSRAEIGNGFRPCTRVARLYSFPSENQCFLRFLDTRGLGEVGQESADEIPVLEAQAHLLIVVIKAMDHAQQCVLEQFHSIKKRHPQWPVIVLQTCLHEGYPAPGAAHVLPYPFTEPPYSPAVPLDLARSLIAQRTFFEGYSARFVPVDFTLPEDGFAPVDYGLDALWNAIEELVPLGLQGMLGQTPAVRQAFHDEFFRVAHPHVVAYALAAGGAGAVPVPFVDVPLVLAIQAQMLHAVASIYRQPMDVQRMAEIASALGIGFLTRLGVRELLKLVPIPIVSSSVSALYAAACTYALGTALCQYFSRAGAGDMPDAKVLRKLYAEEFKQSHQWINERIRQRASAKEPAV
jgi:uncharacterized protein (DUF697 family)